MADTTQVKDMMGNSWDVPVVFYAETYGKEKKAYLGPRKVDAAPQATFHYGDGKYVVQFHYTKDGKAAERGGASHTTSHAEDNSKYLLQNGEPIIDGGGSIWMGD